MKARIYQRSKNAMQSGRSRVGQWILEYESNGQKHPDPLMGWTQSPDTLAQIRLKFDTAEKAKEFATQKGLEYTIATPHNRRVKPRNYGQNFRYRPPEED